MQITYDDKADAIYIHLTESMIVSSKSINPNFRLDVDEHDMVIGIEILNVRKLGIDPLEVTISHAAPHQEVERPDEEAIRQGRIARMEALKRQREKQKETQP